MSRGETTDGTDARDDGAPRGRFSSRFDPRPARVFVGAGLFAFALFGLAGIAAQGRPPITALLCAAILVAHFWPALRPAKPAIDFGPEGFRLDGLGLVPWEAVRRARWRETARGTARAAGRLRFAIIEVELVAPFALSVVRPDDNPPWRRLQTRNFRRLGPTGLMIVVSGLEDGPLEVRAAFEHFLGRPIDGVRGLVA